jgi:hypothetical protein
MINRQKNEYFVPLSIYFWKFPREISFRTGTGPLKAKEQEKTSNPHFSRILQQQAVNINILRALFDEKGTGRINLMPIERL